MHYTNGQKPPGESEKREKKNVSNKKDGIVKCAVMKGGLGGGRGYVRILLRGI